MRYCSRITDRSRSGVKMEVQADMTRALKTFRKVPRYGHAVGRIMVREAALLDWQRTERLVGSDYDDCLEVLRETSFGPYMEDATVSDEIERGLQRFLVDEYDFIDEICRGSNVAEFLHVKYDFHNLRVILKRKYFDGSAERMLSELGQLDVDAMAESADRRQYGELPVYWENLIERLKGELEEGAEDPGFIDTIIDRSYLERRLELARAEKTRFLVNYARAAIDVANLGVILRGREFGKDREYYQQALAEGGRLDKSRLVDLSGDPFDRMAGKLLSTQYGDMLEEALKSEEKGVRLTSLDRHSDEYLLEKLGTLGRIRVGPERIVRYMLTRENEVVLLRILLMGKLHKLSAAAIEERICAICTPFSREGRER